MALSKKKKFKILLGFEIFIIILLALVVFFITKLGKLNFSKLDVNNLNAKDIKGFTNIMLFGVDARGSELKGNTRSDTMILCSINEDTKEVSLTSFYRDYYTFSPEKAGTVDPKEISDKDFDKLTHAYVKGYEAAIKEINTNFQLDIQDFVTVNFVALVRIVDELGGIEIDVPPDKVSEVNKYGSDIAKKHNEKFTPINKSGLQPLNGYQALGYSRTRKKDSDFNRAQRQREVINKIFEKIKSGKGIASLNSIFNCVAENMTTSLSKTQILGYLKDAPKYSIRKELPNGFGNGFPYHQYPAKINGSWVVLSKSPLDDVITLHYNLFNNGVLPDYLTESTSSSSSNGTQTTNNSNTSTTENTETTETPKSLNYNYTPNETVQRIASYQESMYNNAPKQ